MTTGKLKEYKAKYIEARLRPYIDSISSSDVGSKNFVHLCDLLDLFELCDEIRLSKKDVRLLSMCGLLP